MELKLNEKTFVIVSPKARMFRDALAVKEEVDFNDLKTVDLDKMVDFICKVYGKQFTRDEVYDGLEVEELLEAFTGAINGTTGGATATLDRFPTEQ